jgi:hypothetical protein
MDGPWIMIVPGLTNYVAGMQFVNDRFFELTGLSQGPFDKFDWFSIIANEDLKMVESDWARMLEGKRSGGVQFRVKKTWVTQDGVHSNIWLQSSNHAEVDGQGNVLSEYNHQHCDHMLIVEKALWVLFSTLATSNGQKACNVNASKRL